MMSTGQRVLPTLLPMCASIDSLFVRVVGPLGAYLAQEALQEWLKGRRRSRPADVESYIQMLAQHISSPEQKATFIQNARNCIAL